MPSGRVPHMLDLVPYFVIDFVRQDPLRAFGLVGLACRDLADHQFRPARRARLCRGRRPFRRDDVGRLIHLTFRLRIDLAGFRQETRRLCRAPVPSTHILVVPRVG